MADMTLSTDELLDLDLRARDDDWSPTPHGVFMAEMLAEHGDLVRGKDVLELGGGVGNHTIVMLKRGARSVVTAEITEEINETTRRNVARHCPGAVVEYRVADWLDTDGSFDVIVFVQSSMADLAKTNRRLVENGFDPTLVGWTEGPFRDHYFEDASFMAEIRDVPDGFEIRDGEDFEKPNVIRARLERWPPPAEADDEEIQR